MIFSSINIEAVIMAAMITLGFVTIFALYAWIVRLTDANQMLARALELSAKLTAPCIVNQDPEDWRIALGEATHPKYGRVKFQTIGVLIGSVKLQIMDLRGFILDERPLIVA